MDFIAFRRLKGAVLPSFVGALSITWEDPTSTSVSHMRTSLTVGEPEEAI